MKVIALQFSTFQVVVRLPENPTSYAWSGGAALANDPVLPSISVTKDEYMEKGHNVCHERYYL